MSGKYIQRDEISRTWSLGSDYARLVGTFLRRRSRDRFSLVAPKSNSCRLGWPSGPTDWSDVPGTPAMTYLPRSSDGMVACGERLLTLFRFLMNGTV